MMISKFLVHCRAQIYKVSSELPETVGPGWWTRWHSSRYLAWSYDLRSGLHNLFSVCIDCLQLAVVTETLAQEKLSTVADGHQEEANPGADRLRGPPRSAGREESRPQTRQGRSVLDGPHPGVVQPDVGVRRRHSVPTSWWCQVRRRLNDPWNGFEGSLAWMAWSLNL